MYRKFITLLNLIAGELLKYSSYDNETIAKATLTHYDISSLIKDIKELENSELITDNDLDTLQMFLVYILTNETKMDDDDIYSIVFGKGKRILWN